MRLGLKGVLAALVASLLVYKLLEPPSEADGYPPDTHGLNYMVMVGMYTYFAHNNEMTSLRSKLFREGMPLKGQRILLTGCTKGLGRGIAAHLLGLGADLICPCRKIPDLFEDQMLKDSQDLAKMVGANFDKSQAGKITALKMDLGDLESIDQFIENLSKTIEKNSIDVVVSNAGLISVSGTSKQGFETTFAVNFLGPAHLIKQLIAKDMLSSENPVGKPSIITVSSGEHRSTQRLDKSYIKFGGSEDGGYGDVLVRYAHSKLALTTFALGMAKKHKEIRFIDLCPGPVGSEIASGHGFISKMAVPVLNSIFPDRNHAAMYIVRLITEPEFKDVSGRHYHTLVDFDARSDARDPGMQDLVLSKTDELLKSRNPIQ